MPPAVDERNTLKILEDFPVNGLLGNKTQKFTLQKCVINK